MNSRDSLESVRISSPVRPAAEVDIVVKEHHEKKGMNMGMLLFWLLAVFIIVFILLALFTPTWVMKTDNPEEVDWGKVALTSFIIALIAVIIVWLVMSARRY